MCAQLLWTTCSMPVLSGPRSFKTLDDLSHCAAAPFKVLAIFLLPWPSSCSATIRLLRSSESSLPCGAMLELSVTSMRECESCKTNLNTPARYVHWPLFQKRERQGRLLNLKICNFSKYNPQSTHNPAFHERIDLKPASFSVSGKSHHHHHKVLTAQTSLSLSLSLSLPLSLSLSLSLINRSRQVLPTTSSVRTDGLVCFNGISTIVDYLMPNPFFYIQTVLFQFSLA